MDTNYGLLLKEKDILLQRNYFNELVNMLGIRVIHRAPRPNKHYTIYSEISANYFEPEAVGCIFDEHPNQRTMKKLGWNSELSENAAVISVPYDLKGLQQGSLFIIPSAFDHTAGRLFRVVEITGIMIYPASLTCKLVPEFENILSQDSFNHQHNSFNLLNRED